MKSRVMNLTKLTLFLATGVLGTGTSARAQADASVTIPFAFSANNQNISAGNYKLHLVSNCFLSLLNVETGHSQFLMVRPEGGVTAVETRGRLIFKQYGTHKYLSQIWLVGSSFHSEMVVSHKPARLLAKEDAPTKGGMSGATSIVLAMK